MSQTVCVYVSKGRFDSFGTRAKHIIGGSRDQSGQKNFRIAGYMSFVLSAEMYNEIQNSKTIRQQILTTLTFEIFCVQGNRPA